MKKVIFALLLVAALSLALVTPALADEGGQPNDDADWGQVVRGVAVGGGLHAGDFVPGCVPLQWGEDGIPGAHGHSHGP